MCRCCVIGDAVPPAAGAVSSSFLATLCLRRTPWLSSEGIRETAHITGELVLRPCWVPCKMQLCSVVRCRELSNYLSLCSLAACKVQRSSMQHIAALMQSMARHHELHRRAPHLSFGVLHEGCCLLQVKIRVPCMSIPQCSLRAPHSSRVTSVKEPQHDVCNIRYVQCFKRTYA